MKILENKKACCGCFACFNSCPVHAIEMLSDNEEFKYPVINEDICIQCNKCKQVCPILQQLKRNTQEKAYIAYASNEEERMSSSSGGAFAVFAKYILLSGGSVCGATYNEKMEVEHCIITSTEELYQLKGTKYVQSNVNNVYEQIRLLLKKDVNVLFSGTPCQVAGLKSFLRKDYDNLICIDLICHGVPSPEIWKDYLSSININKDVKHVNFRYKNLDKKTTQIAYYLDDNSIVLEEKNDSLYMKGFIQNLYVRPSCFDCRFKGNNRMSDITIGDFWSAKEFHADMADDYGNSAIIIRSDKGQSLLEAVKNELVIKDATIKEVVTWNECLVESTKMNEKRKEFYERWRKEPLQSILEDLTKKEMSEKAKEKNAFPW